MRSQEYNILIVDDDTQFAESLKTGISRAGFRCHCVHSPEEALSYVRIQDVHAMIVDCMLPKMNGLELVKKLQELTPKNVHLFLMSGIFKDKQFIKTAKSKTSATDFFSKPFQISDLIERLESLMSDEGDEEDGFNPLVRLYLNRDIKIRKLIKLINNSEGLHNFDLPWVFKMLIDSQATGHLNIACTNGDIAGVGFLNGKIVQVNIENEASLLGLLLIEQGYLDRSDLNEAAKKQTDNKMIGQHLIEQNFVSPHAIDVVVKEQLLWRLRRLIADSQMELNFVKSEEVTTISSIDEQDFHMFTADIIEHTIREDWLKTHYLPLSQNLIKLREDKEKELSDCRLLPFVSRIFPSIDTQLRRGTSLEELLTNNGSIEVSILKLIHFLNILDLLEVTNSQKTLNFSHQIKRLQKLESELDNKNYFERLGVSQSAKEADIKKAYLDLAKVLHPEKLDNETPSQVQALSEKVFEKIQIAYDTLKQEERKSAYLKELEASQSEQLLEGDRIFEGARQLTSKGQYSQARHSLQKAFRINPESSDIKIHLIWVELKLTKKPNDRFLADIDKRLNQIPIESRDTAPYYHCRGLYYMALNDQERASKYFGTALNIDSSFISARREISQLSSKKDSTNILTMDLGQVMGQLFKK